MYFLRKNVFSFLVLSFSLFIFTACGYKPSSTYIHHLFEDDIYVEVTVDTAEPENAPFVKDEMNRLVYTRFKGHVVDKNSTKNYIKVSYRGSRFSPVSYENGYVTRYRADIRVKFKMMTKDGKLTRSITAQHEDDIQASSLASSTLRTEAIKRGLEKALDQFLAYASAKGLMVAQAPKKRKVIKKPLKKSAKKMLKP